MDCVANVTWNEMRESIGEKEIVPPLKVVRSIRDMFIDSTLCRRSPTLVMEVGVSTIWANHLDS